MTAINPPQKSDISDVRLQLVILVLMLAYYAFLLTDGSFDFFKPTQTGMTFNSMIEHMLRGQFDVDPEAVGGEGYRRDGRIYAYWGIFCAILRLPLLAFPDGLATDVTTLSCLAAACLAGAMKIRTALIVRRHCLPDPACGLAFALLAAYIVLGGAGVGYLRASLFQEVASWAAALGAVFVYCAVRGIVLGRFTAGLLAWMAAAAGLALLTRVSAGIGLYAALGLLLLALILGDAAGRGAGAAGRLGAALLSPRVLAPAAVLIGFAAVTGMVNTMRWGSPTTFVDLSLSVVNHIWPDRLPRMQEYGLFNIGRIPYGLAYYFVPVWILRGADGTLIFEAVQTRLLDSAELPPGSFLLTDLLPLVFIVLLIASVRRAPQLLPLGQVLALGAGLAVPCVLMLTAISMNYRYRMEFYPLIDLLAFLGFYAAGSSAATIGILRRCRWWMIGALLVSVASAHLALALYKLSPWGPGHLALRDGVLKLYAWRVMRRLGL